MDPSSPSLAPAKPDNLLGICHALGQVFGIEPLYLRIALLAAMLTDFQLALLAYGVAGIAVAGTGFLDRAAAKLLTASR